MTTNMGAGIGTLPLTHNDFVHIRLAGWRDQARVCRLECACFGWERLLFGLWPRAGRRGVGAWVAEVDGRWVGYLISYERELNNQPVWYVGGVGVLKSHRCGGIATHLMGAVLAKHPMLWLHVRAGNRAALALYEKLGMREMQRLKRFYSNSEDAVVMVTPDLL